MRGKTRLTQRRGVTEPSQAQSPSLLLTDLPEVVLCRIFSFLPLRALADVASVSPACSQALVGQDSHLVWRRHLNELEELLRGDESLELEDGNWLEEYQSIPPYPGSPPPGLLPTVRWKDGPMERCFHPETAQPQYLFHSDAEAPKQEAHNTLTMYSPIWVGLDSPHHCAACGGLRFETHESFRDHCRNSAMHAELMQPPDKRLPVELRDPRFFDPPAWAALSDHLRFRSLHMYRQRVLQLLRAPLTAEYTHDPAAKAGRLRIQRMCDELASDVDDHIAQYPGMSRREQAEARARCSRKQVTEHMVRFAEEMFHDDGLIRDDLARDVCIGGYGKFGAAEWPAEAYFLFCVMDLT